MRLHENQLDLIRHLAQFNLLNYPSCLKMLDAEGTGDRVALSYAFRPLTKNGYLSKRKDGSVGILAKGRALFPDVEPLISVGGGTAERKRVMEVSRMAVLMAEQGIPSFGELQPYEGDIEDQEPYFIPSACWRKIAPGILSTTRFTGMLLAYGMKWAVYDIGDGSVEWQVRAESSLFYTRYGSYQTRADGMILLCQDDKRDQVAENIIRQTMWSRRQLLSNCYTERSRPVRWSRSPIKLRAQYEHVYLTTPSQLEDDLDHIYNEGWQIDRQRGDGRLSHDPRGIMRCGPTVILPTTPPIC